MVKCEVIVDRISLVCGKGSVVVIDDKQYELARKFVKPIVEEPKAEEKAVKKSRKK